MAGGRRRRRGSANSGNNNNNNGNNNGRGGSKPEADTQRAAEIKPETPAAPIEDSQPTSATGASAGRLAQLGLGAEDDPFAYDSDLETLSSVSSHSSISSPDGSVLDQAMEPQTAGDPDPIAEANGRDDNEGEAGHSSIEMEGQITGGCDIPTSADTAIHEESPPEASEGTTGRSASDKAGSDSDALDLADQTLHSAGKASSGPRSSRSRRSSSAATKRANSKRPGARQKSSSDEDEGSLRSSEAAAAGDAAEDDKMEVGSDAEKKASAVRMADDDNGGSGSDSEADKDPAQDEARRAAALTELTSIEMEFAQLRERLYSERLQQVQIEEEYLFAGQHSEYERCVDEISQSHEQQLEKLHYAHEAWLEQRQHLHETWVRTLNYTFLVRRQELRSRMVRAQQRRLWRLRDMRVQEDRRAAERSGRRRQSASFVDEDMALIAQTSDNMRQIRHARRAAGTAQRCLVHSRKQQLAVPGLDASEMDADYAAMNLPVYPREQRASSGFRQVFVPSLAAEPASSAQTKKRRSRQQRQPRKKQAPNRDIPPGPGADTSAAPEPRGPAAQNGVAKAPSAAAAAAVAAASGQARQQPRVNGHTPAKVLQSPPLNSQPPPAPLPADGALQKAILTSSATVVVASAGEKSSGDRSSHGSVDMHVPPGSSGALGLKV